MSKSQQSCRRVIVLHTAAVCWPVRASAALADPYMVVSNRQGSAPCVSQPWAVGGIRVPPHAGQDASRSIPARTGKLLSVCALTYIPHLSVVTRISDRYIIADGRNVFEQMLHVGDGGLW